MGHIIGIDLGTTNSVVAYLEGGKPTVMQNAEGGKTTPSVVLYREDGQIVVGELAKRQRRLSPKRTIYSVKRFVGCRWEESQSRFDGIDYPLAEGSDGQVAVMIGEEALLPEHVQAETLRKMKETAEEYLGEVINQAVITCPAYFNDGQRQATKQAAEMAGLEALRIINEPTAAALAYGLNQARDEKIAVFDFGGGTFDISILEIETDVFEVKSTCGDTNLGGDNIDFILINYILSRIEELHGLNLRENGQAMSRIAEAAEKAKCELSSTEKTTIALPFIGADASGPKHYNEEMDRDTFNTLIEPILNRLMVPCQQALDDAGLTKDKIGSVILVGGSTRIPAVRTLVEKFFGRKPEQSVDPDLAVAMGASIQAAIMSGEIDEIILLDVTPLSLGIELAGGVFSPLIGRNSSIPTTVKKKFTTVRDNQEAVKVHVLQGERKKAIENRTLARFRLEGITPAPREVPEIEVSFTIDANGILQVAAMDLTSGNLTHVQVESYQPQSEFEVKKKVEEAEKLADDDRQFMRKLMVRRRLEEMRQDFMKAQSEDSERTYLSESLERRIFEGIFRLEVALAQDDWTIIDDADRDLKAAFSEMQLMAARLTGEAMESEIVFETIEIEDKAPKAAPPASAGE